MSSAKTRGELCRKGCGKYVESPSGICNQCRTTVCKKCGAKLRQMYEGQLRHGRCILKESA